MRMSKWKCKGVPNFLYPVRALSLSLPLLFLTQLLSITHWFFCSYLLAHCRPFIHNCKLIYNSDSVQLLCNADTPLCDASLLLPYHVCVYIFVSLSVCVCKRTHQHIVRAFVSIGNCQKVSNDFIISNHPRTCEWKKKKMKKKKPTVPTGMISNA